MIAKRISIANFALACVILGEALYWLSAPQPFFNPLWVANIPPSSRFQMTRWMIKNRSLQGLSEKDVRKLLNFGDRECDSEVVDVEGDTLLMTDVSTLVTWASMTVRLRNGRVIDVSLFED